MKKFVTSLLVCLVMVCSLTVTSFADDVSTQQYGVICDADGNVVEHVAMSRGLFVDSIHTIPAGGYFRSYWYKPLYYFNAGFRFHDDDGNLVTTPGTQINLAIYNSTEIGGVSNTVMNDDYSTNYTEDHYYDFSGMVIDTIDHSHPYYYAMYRNKTNKPITLRLIIECNIS